MSLKRSFHFFILIFFQFSCGSSLKKEKNAFSSHLVKEEEVSLPIKHSIDHLGYNRIRPYFDKENRKDYVTIWTLATDTLKFFDVQAKKEVMSLSFKGLFKNDPGIGDYYIHSRDSIFVLSRNTNEIALCNFAGEPLKTWRVTQPMHSGNTNYILYSVSELKYLNNKIYTAQINTGLGAYNKEFNKSWFSENSGAILELNPNEVKINNKIGSFPKALNENSRNCQLPSTALNNNEEFIFSFQPFSELDVYAGTGENRQVKVESIYFKEMPLFAEDSLTNGNYIERYSVEAGGYLYLYYDRFRDLYYRVYLHGMPYENADGTVNTIDDVNWSLMIIDKDFKLIGEQLFKGTEYNFRNLLITKEGILIRKNLKKPVNGSYFIGNIFKVENDA